MPTALTSSMKITITIDHEPSIVAGEPRLDRRRSTGSTANVVSTVGR